MKKRFPLKFLAAISALSMFAVVTGTVAWFNQYAIIDKDDSPFGGSASGAYFAYGNGTPTTAEHPENRVYGITVPRHLYNLAWLQYLGYFNLEEENGKQYYFELGDNIDMTGWTLPPIGTEEHPFIGNFNGNGYVVQGLTVSNKFNDFTRHPGVVTSGNFEQPHIMGFFGVIGNYDDIYGDSSDYSSAANEFTNTGLTGITVKTYLRDSLMGVAAGYVSGNMKNVAVDASTINLDSSITGTTTSYGGFTDNISDFSLVGYTTNAQQVKKVDESIYDVTISANHEFNATEQGDTTGWGGSINMRTIYQRLYGLKVRVPVTGETLNHRINYYYYDNVENTSERTTRTNARMYYYHGYNTNNHNYIGNYSFLNRGTNSDSFMYLSGGHYESYSYTSSVVHTGYRITDGTNYLTFNGNAIGNTTTEANATPWTFVLYSNNTYYIRYTYNNTTYYLYNNNGTLTLGTGTSTNANARWNVNQNGNNLNIVSASDTSKKIYYDEGWKLITASGSETYYLLKSGNNYVSVNSTSNATVTNTTNVNDAAHFVVDGNNNVYFRKAGSTTNYYLMAYYRNNRTPGLRVYTSTSGNYLYPFTYVGGTLSARYNNTTTYYARYNNGWTVATSNYNISLTEVSVDYDAMVLSNTLSLPESSITGPDYNPTTEDTQKGADKSHMYFTYSDTTYFPINVNEDGGSFTNATAVNNAINAGNFDPKTTNTGYITAGSDYENHDVNITANNYDNMRNDISKVRISEYAISNIENSFNTSWTKYSQFSDANIYTINSSGTKRTMSQEYNENIYPRYQEAKKSFYSNALTTAYNANTDTYTVASNVYGLHFMDATISMDTIVNGRNVSILGNNYNNYELPVNAVDFNLKQKGVVNFFAGTYFSGNNSFFSLHEIFRNADTTISGIKEIEEIYTTDVGSKTTKYANIYKYKDKTGNEMYSVPYRLDVEQNRFVMNMNNTDENDTPYSYATMNETDFNTYKNTYGYQLRFKTSQIGRNAGSISQDYSIFYYEFPMNEGEYCLGSVDGGTGAYLLYLDIGANASKFQRTIINEHFTYEELVMAFPGGVALVSLPETVSKEVAVLDISEDLDCTNSVCVEIHGGYTDSFTIDRNQGDVTLTRTNQSNAPPIYRSEEITLLHDSGSSTDIDVIPVSNDVKDVKRLTYLDVNVNMVTFSKTIITDTSVNNGAITRTITQANYASTDPTEDPEITYIYDSENDQRDLMKIYNTSNGVRYTSDEILDTSLLPVTGSDTLLLTVRVVQNGGLGYEEDILAEISIDPNNLTGTYYMFDDYLITITPNGQDVLVYVKSFTSGRTVYYGTTQVTGAQQVITIAA